MSPRTVEPEPRQETVARRSVVVIDDDLEVAESLASLLRLLGHEVVVAISGLHGIEIARKMQPNVVICDISLPGMDGYAVARAFREEGSTAHLIALSGHTHADDRERARQAGFDVYLTKPVEAEVVESVIAESPRKMR